MLQILTKRLGWAGEEDNHHKNEKINISDILMRLYLMCCLFFVLPHFDITYDVPLSEKTHSKICYKFPFYHLSVEPEDEHGGIDASTQQLQRESKWKRASRKT